MTGSFTGSRACRAELGLPWAHTLSGAGSAWPESRGIPGNDRRGRVAGVGLQLHVHRVWRRFLPRPLSVSALCFAFTRAAWGQGPVASVHSDRRMAGRLRGALRASCRCGETGGPPGLTGRVPPPYPGLTLHIYSAYRTLARV